MQDFLYIKLYVYTYINIYTPHPPLNNPRPPRPSLGRPQAPRQRWWPIVVAHCGSGSPSPEPPGSSWLRAFSAAAEALASTASPCSLLVSLDCVARSFSSSSAWTALVFSSSAHLDFSAAIVSQAFATSARSLLTSSACHLWELANVKYA